MELRKPDVPANPGELKLAHEDELVAAVGRVGAAAVAAANAAAASVVAGALAAPVAVAAPPAVAAAETVAPPQTAPQVAAAAALHAARGQGAPSALPVGAAMGLPAPAADFQQLQQQIQLLHELPPEMKTASYIGFLASIPMTMTSMGGDGLAGGLPWDASHRQ